MESQRIHPGPGLQSPSDRDHDATSSGRPHPRWSNSALSLDDRWGRTDLRGGRGVRVRKTVISSYSPECCATHKALLCTPGHFLPAPLFCEELRIIILISETKKIRPSRCKKPDCRTSRPWQKGNLNLNFWYHVDALLKFRAQSALFIKSLRTGPGAEDPGLLESSEGMGLLRTSAWAQCQGYHFHCLPVANPVEMEVLLQLRRVSRILEWFQQHQQNVERKLSGNQSNSKSRWKVFSLPQMPRSFPFFSCFSWASQSPLRMQAPFRALCSLHLYTPPSWGTGIMCCKLQPHNRGLLNENYLLCINLPPSAGEFTILWLFTSFWRGLLNFPWGFFFFF